MSDVKINKNSSYKELTPGGTIYDAGNSLNFKTGDWRSVKPIYLSEKCTQCGLCFPVCPDDAIPVNKELQREDFDYYACKGCGVCMKACPLNAITMVPEE